MYMYKYKNFHAIDCTCIALSFQSSSPATDQADLSITVSLLNYQLVCESGSSASSNHCCVLIIGDKDDGIILKQRIKYIAQSVLNIN